MHLVPSGQEFSSGIKAPVGKSGKKESAGVSASFLSGKIKETEYFRSKTGKGEKFYEEIKSFRCVLLCVAKAVV